MHVRKEPRKLRKMLTDDVTLCISLFQQTLLNDKLHVLLSDGNVLIAVVDLVEHIGSILKLW